MPSQQAIQTLLAGEKSKLREIFDWIQENCDQHQKEEISKIIGQYDFLFTFPDYKFRRPSPIVGNFEIPPTTEEVNQRLEQEPREKVRRDIIEQMDKRRRLMNGTAMELEELKHKLEEIEE